MQTFVEHKGRGQKAEGKNQEKGRRQKKKGLGMGLCRFTLRSFA